MRRNKEDFEDFAGELQTFLTSAGWLKSKQAKGLTFYQPPDALGISGKYSIALPDDVTRPGMDRFLHGAADSLQSIYGVADVGELMNKAAALGDHAGPARFVSRFIDSTTSAGSMPLASIGTYVANMEKSFYSGAKFKLGDDSKGSRLIAQKFAKECLFLQSEVGSFVANVEVPQMILRQADWFGHEALTSSEVCSALFSAIQFINEQVFNDGTSLDSDQSLRDAIALFDVELLESLEKMLVNPEMDTIEFAFKVGEIVRSSSTGLLSDEKIDRLKKYVDFIRKTLLGEREIDVSGSIVELRSRDPEGNRNYIRVVSQFHGDRTFITATLSNEQYQRAVDAHRSKRSVRLQGEGMRLKTQVRLTKVDAFSA